MYSIISKDDHGAMRRFLLSQGLPTEPRALGDPRTSVTIVGDAALDRAVDIILGMARELGATAEARIGIRGL